MGAMSKTVIIFIALAAVLTCAARAAECPGCGNHCEIVRFYRDNALADVWGGRCDRSKTGEF